MSVINPKPWPFKSGGARGTWTVSPDGYADFLTIGEAVAVATVDDTILVGPGDYPERVALNNAVHLVALNEQSIQANGASNPRGARINPVLATGQIALDVQTHSVVVGFRIEPTTPVSFAGSATAVRLLSGELHNCHVRLATDPSSITGPFYAISRLGSGNAAIVNCAVQVGLVTSGTRRALFHSDQRLRAYHCRFYAANGAGTVEINGAGARFVAFGCEFEDGLFNTLSTDFYVDSSSVCISTRTSPGDVRVEGVTPDGAIWYDTTTSKLRGREGGVSKDVIPAASGASLTRISGITGAAGADFTAQILTANSADVTTVALSASVMTTTGLGVGTWKFKYILLYQAAATTTGIAFGVNHTGTTTKFRGRWTHITTGGAAATGVGDNDTTTVAGQMAEGKADNAINAVIGSASAGVAVANSDIMAILEGIVVVSVSGNLELKIATEVAGSAVRITASSTLELLKVA